MAKSMGKAATDGKHAGNKGKNVPAMKMAKKGKKAGKLPATKLFGGKK